MTSLLTTEVGIQTWILIAVVLILLGVVGATIWLTVSVKDLQKPKFGFGGKPLALIATAVLTLLIPLSLYVTKQRIDTIQHASSLNDVTISIFEISDQGDSAQIAFSGVPIQNGQAWGDDNLYQFEWTITGEQDITFTESDRSSDYPSYFVLSLPKGDYEVTLRVTSTKYDITREQEFTAE